MRGATHPCRAASWAARIISVVVFSCHCGVFPYLMGFVRAPSCRAEGCAEAHPAESTNYEEE